MKRILLFLIVLITFFNSNAFSKNDGWSQRNDFFVDVGNMVYKQEGNIKYTFYSDVSMLERNTIIEKTKTYIQENLAFLNESELHDSIDIILVRDRNDMLKHVGATISGMTFPSTDEYIKQKMIVCIGGDKNPLKHELMHMVSMCKWGVPEDFHNLSWLMEGLATYADPDAECDDYSFEEKYIYFIQNKKLINTDSLVNHFDKQHDKIRYNQSAYIVQFLINNYGIEKMKKLWVDKMDNFIGIYSSSFEDIIKKIEAELVQKYPEPIEFDWNEFEKKCY